MKNLLKENILRINELMGIKSNPKINLINENIVSKEGTIIVDETEKLLGIAEKSVDERVAQLARQFEKSIDQTEKNILRSIVNGAEKAETKLANLAKFVESSPSILNKITTQLKTEYGTKVNAIYDKFLTSNNNGNGNVLAQWYEDAIRATGKPSAGQKELIRICEEMNPPISKECLERFFEHTRIRPGANGGWRVEFTMKPMEGPNVVPNVNPVDDVIKVNLSKRGEQFLNAVNTSPEFFYYPNWSTSNRQSGWKFHIFADNSMDSAIVADKIHDFCVENNVTYKITTSKGYSGGYGIKGEDQYGKAVTVYIPTDKINNVKDFLAKLQSKLSGYEKTGNIMGDQMITGNIGYRYELKQPIDPVVGIDYPTYQNLYDKNRGGNNYNIPGNPDLFQLETSINVSTGVKNPKVFITGTKNGFVDLQTGRDPKGISDPRGTVGHGKSGEYKSSFNQNETSLNVVSPATDGFGRTGNIQLSIVVPNELADRIDLGLLRAKFDSELNQIMKDYGMYDMKLGIGAEQKIPDSRWKQLENDMISFVENPTVAREPVKTLDINQPKNDPLWDVNNDIGGYSPKITPVNPNPYTPLDGKRISNRSFGVENINWSKMDPNYNRNLFKLNQNIATAIVRGEWALVPIGGFEKFGINNFREYLMNSIERVNEVNPSTGRWSVNFKETGPSNLPKTSGVPEDKSNAQRNSFGGYSGSN